MAFKDLMKTVKNEAGDAVEITKLKAKISKEKTVIKDNYEEIGKIIYEKYKLGGAGSEIDPLIAAINTAKNNIEGYNQEIEKVKAN